MVRKKITREQWKQADKATQQSVRKIRRFGMPDVMDLIVHLEYPVIKNTFIGMSVFTKDTYYGEELVDALWNATIKNRGGGVV